IVPYRETEFACGRNRKARVAIRHHLVVPRGSMLGIEFSLDLGEETLRRAEVHSGSNPVGTGPVQAAIKHAARRAAAVVADAVEVHHEWRAGVEFSGDGDISCDSGRVNIVYVVVRKVSQDAASIRRLPPEEFQWQLIGVVPGH